MNPRILSFVVLSVVFGSTACWGQPPLRDSERVSQDNNRAANRVPSVPLFRLISWTTRPYSYSAPPLTRGNRAR